MSRKYPLPPFLEGREISETKYNDWLARKSLAHWRRDKNRGNVDAVNEQYKRAIHAAIVESAGFDQYTGEALNWNLIGTYDNELAKLGGRKYKALHDLLPTVDHVDDGLGEANFKICGYRTNDAKGAMSHEEFIAFCRLVVAHSEKK